MLKIAKNLLNNTNFILVLVLAGALLLTNLNSTLSGNYYAWQQYPGGVFYKYPGGYVAGTVARGQPTPLDCSATTSFMAAKTFATTSGLYPRGEVQNKEIYTHYDQECSYRCKSSGCNYGQFYDVKDLDEGNVRVSCSCS